MNEPVKTKTERETSESFPNVKEKQMKTKEFVVIIHSGGKHKLYTLRKYKLITRIKAAAALAAALILIAICFTIVFQSRGYYRTLQLAGMSICSIAAAAALITIEYDKFKEK